MRRLNVDEEQLNTCIRHSVYAISYEPKDPPLQPGELLLLQLNKDDARKRQQLKSRINFAIVFDHLEPDYDGTISRFYWPNAGKEWPQIVFGSATMPTVPFSLEDISLSKRYQGSNNPGNITKQDEELILPYIQWDLPEVPSSALQFIPASQVSKRFGQERALSTIYNHDYIANLHPVSRKLIKEGFVGNHWLSESLKAYYEYRCQICDIDFEPRYGVPMANTHHIQDLAQGGSDMSSNMIVVCPNHHHIIRATDAYFNRQSLTYEYVNGLREPLIRTDHFVNAPSFSAQ